MHTYHCMGNESVTSIEEYNKWDQINLQTCSCFFKRCYACVYTHASKLAQCAQKHIYSLSVAV